MPASDNGESLTRHPYPPVSIRARRPAVNEKAAETAFIVFCDGPRSILGSGSANLDLVLHRDYPLGVLGDRDRFVHFLLRLRIAGQCNDAFVGVDVDFQRADLLVDRK